MYNRLGASLCLMCNISCMLVTVPTGLVLFIIAKIETEKNCKYLALPNVYPRILSYFSSFWREF